MPHGIVKDKTYYKREKESAKLRMAGGAWSINVSEVDFLKVDNIYFLTEKQVYEISTDDATKHGFFRNLGGEDKLVVPLKNWSIRDVGRTDSKP